MTYAQYDDFVAENKRGIFIYSSGVWISRYTLNIASYSWLLFFSQLTQNFVARCLEVQHLLFFLRRFLK